MRLVKGGAVQSGNLPTRRNSGIKLDFRKYRGMVTDVKYVGDPRNITNNHPNPQVLYDVVVLGGNASGQLITNCRLSSDIADNDNYHEIVLRAATTKPNETRLSQQDGAVVWVEFNQGMKSYPIITGLDQGLKTGENTGATKEDGVRDKRVFNGVTEEIDKNGNKTTAVPDGQFLKLGDLDPDDFMALAGLVLEELKKVKLDFDALKSVFDAHTHPHGPYLAIAGAPVPTSPPLAPAPTAHTPQSVASEKVKSV